MGFPLALFSEEPDDEWICAICHEVLEYSVATPCGHSFCCSCLQQCVDEKDECPTCRTARVDTHYVLERNFQAHILKSNVKCGLVNKEEPSAGRRKLNDGSAAAAEEAGCGWTGKLSDWEQHCKEECEFSVVGCSVEGCRHRCPRKLLSTHMANDMAHHMELMVLAKTRGLQREFNKKLNEKTKKLEKEFDRKLNEKTKKLEKEFDRKLNEKTKKLENEPRSHGEVLERRLADSYCQQFCQQWMRHKPDALFDFRVYGHRRCVTRVHHPEQNPDDLENATSLLFGIPGPANTPWEGGLFPLVMDWPSIDEPPRFKYPEGFHHVNVYPSGTVCVSTLIPLAGWKTDFSLPEMLFSIQAHLAHPNANSPSQTEAYHVYINDIEKYNSKAKLLVNKYPASASSKDFLAAARTAFGPERIPPTLSLIDDEDGRWTEEGAFHPGQKIIPVSRPPTPKAKNGTTCDCSCCAWGSTFWDSRREMRFIFGEGG